MERDGDMLAGVDQSLEDSRDAVDQRQSDQDIKNMREHEQYLMWRREISAPRHQDPRRLTHHGFKVFSQCDEDGIIQEIFFRIGSTNRTFVEFGVGNGSECNTAWLLMQGWAGIWLDADAASCQAIEKTYGDWLKDGSLSLINTHLTTNNVDTIIAENCRQKEIDLLSIDVDNNDYWIWEAVDRVSPRVVVIEYNSSWPPPASMTVPYEPEKGWGGTNYFGASLAALANLGRRKGYDLVGCSISGVNAFFVRRDLSSGRFLAVGDVREHYEPPRYFLCCMPAGHPPEIGRVVHIGTDE